MSFPERYRDVLYWVAILAVLGAGTLFRSWGVMTGTLDFWADEAWWAANIQVRSLTESGIRPIGYMWMAQQLRAFDHPELMLRLPSYLAGVGVMVFVFLAAARMYTSRLVIVFAVSVIALNPQLIVFAKEFKPFSLEAFIHSGLILWALVCLQSRRPGVSFHATALGAVPFCYNALFLYPGLFYRHIAALLRRLTPLQRMALLASGLAVATMLHVLAYDALNAGARREFWGGKYEVFPAGLGLSGSMSWYAGKTWALITMPLAMHGLDSGAAMLARQLFGFVYMAGLAALATQRRYAELTLLAGPVAMAALANMLGYWPYGAFRTNLFLIPATVLVACQGLEWLFQYPRLRVLVVAFVLLAFLAVFPWNPGYFRTKHMHDGAPSPQLTEALDDMLARYREDAVPVTNIILTDWHSWRPMYYYLELDPRGRDTYADIRLNTTLVRGPLNDAEELAMRLHDVHDGAIERGESTRVWLVVTKLDRFAGILSHPLVTGFGTHVNRFATHDPAYHPVLIELRFPGG